jgi:hypothetical protein
MVKVTSGKGGTFAGSSQTTRCLKKCITTEENPSKNWKSILPMPTFSQNNDFSASTRVLLNISYGLMKIP